MLRQEFVLGGETIGGQAQLPLFGNVHQVLTWKHRIASSTNAPTLVVSDSPRRRRLSPRAAGIGNLRGATKLFCRPTEAELGATDLYFTKSASTTYYCILPQTPRIFSPGPVWTFAHIQGTLLSGRILGPPVGRIALGFGIARVDAVGGAAVVGAHAADAVLAATAEGARLACRARVVGVPRLAILSDDSLCRDSVGGEEDGDQEHKQPQAVPGEGCPWPGVGHCE